MLSRRWLLLPRPPRPLVDERGSQGGQLDLKYVMLTSLEKWAWYAQMCDPKKILSRASAVGSPTNHLGSRQQTRARAPPNGKLPKIEKHGPTIGPVLLRQGEPGTSQYIIRPVKTGLLKFHHVGMFGCFSVHQCPKHQCLLHSQSRNIDPRAIKSGMEMPVNNIYKSTLNVKV